MTSHKQLSSKVKRKEYKPKRVTMQSSRQGASPVKALPYSHHFAFRTIAMTDCLQRPILRRTNLFRVWVSPYVGVGQNLLFHIF